jgi:hypothetical protein
MLDDLHAFHQLVASARRLGDLGVRPAKPPHLQAGTRPCRQKRSSLARPPETSMTNRRLSPFSFSFFFAIGVAALAATLAGASAQTIVPPLNAPNAYPGAYRTTRPGADSMQQLTLTLNRAGNARLLTTYPGYSTTAAGARVYPMVDDGTWRVTQGLARVRFTQTGQLIGGRIARAQPEASEVWFEINGCALRLARDPHRVYGAMGIRFRKIDCR